MCRVLPLVLMGLVFASCATTKTIYVNTAPTRQFDIRAPFTVVAGSQGIETAQEVNYLKKQLAVDGFNVRETGTVRYVFVVNAGSGPVGFRPAPVTAGSLADGLLGRLSNSLTVGGGGNPTYDTSTKMEQVYSRWVQVSLVEVSNEPNHQYGTMDKVWEGYATEDLRPPHMVSGALLAYSILNGFPRQLVDYPVVLELTNDGWKQK